MFPEKKNITRAVYIVLVCVLYRYIFICNNFTLECEIKKIQMMMGLDFSFILFKSPSLSLCMCPCVCTSLSHYIFNILLLIVPLVFHILFICFSNDGHLVISNFQWLRTMLWLITLQKFSHLLWFQPLGDFHHGSDLLFDCMAGHSPIVLPGSPSPW